MCALCGRERKKMKQCRGSEEESTHWKRESSTKNGDKKERQKCERLGWAHSKAQSTQRNDTTIKCDTMKQNKPNRLVKRFDLAEAVLGFLSLMSIPKLSLEWMCVCVCAFSSSFLCFRPTVFLSFAFIYSACNVRMADAGLDFLFIVSNRPFALSQLNPLLLCI